MRCSWFYTPIVPEGFYRGPVELHFIETDSRPVCCRRTGPEKPSGMTRTLELAWCTRRPRSVLSGTSSVALRRNRFPTSVLSQNWPRKALGNDLGENDAYQYLDSINPPKTAHRGKGKPSTDRLYLHPTREPHRI